MGKFAGLGVVTESSLQKLRRYQVGYPGVCGGHSQGPWPKQATKKADPARLDKIVQQLTCRTTGP